MTAGKSWTRYRLHGGRTVVVVVAHSSKKCRARPPPRTTASPHPPTPRSCTRRGPRTWGRDKKAVPFPSSAVPPERARLPCWGRPQESGASPWLRRTIYWAQLSPLRHVVPATGVAVHLLLPALDEILDPDQSEQIKHLLFVRGRARPIALRRWVPESVVMRRVDRKPRPHWLEEVFGGGRCCLRAGLATGGAGELLWVCDNTQREHSVSSVRETERHTMPPWVL
jgi:hypothetical protein